MTETTTPEAIRTNLESILRALVPSSIREARFQVERGDEDFDTWAEANPTAALRRYSLRMTVGPEPPDASDSAIELVVMELELRVAYPKLWALYRAGNVRAIEALIHEDSRLINGRSGIGIHNAAAHLPGQHASRVEGPTIEEGEKVLIAAYTIESTFNQAVQP